MGLSDLTKEERKELVLRGFIERQKIRAEIRKIQGRRDRIGRMRKAVKAVAPRG